MTTYEIVHNKRSYLKSKSFMYELLEIGHGEY